MHKYSVGFISSTFDDHTGILLKKEKIKKKTKRILDETLTLCGYAKCHVTLVADPAKNDVRIEPRERVKEKTTEENRMRKIRKIKKNCDKIQAVNVKHDMFHIQQPIEMLKMTGNESIISSINIWASVKIKLIYSSVRNRPSNSAEHWMREDYFRRQMDDEILQKKT